MPNLNATLTLNEDGDNTTKSFTGNVKYQQLFQLEKTLDDTESPADQALLTLTPGAKGASTTMEELEFLCLYNKGVGTIELAIKLNGNESSTVASADLDVPAAAAICLSRWLLRPGDFISFPNMWGSGYDSAAEGAANTTYQKMDNTVISGALLADILDSADLSTEEDIAEALDASETDVDVDDGSYFIEGDLIQVDDEIMRVTGISTNTLTVERGVYGSTGASHSDDVKLEFPYFNAYHDFNTFAKPQTDSQGNFKCFNYFGRGRNDQSSANHGMSGVCRGTAAFKFYEAGFIEFGKSNIRPNNDSGLTANTAYAFDLILNEVVEKSSVTAKGTITFTTHTSNTNWGTASKGGTGTGVLQKIQNAMDAKFNDVTDALHGLGATIEFIGGDIRITSHSRLSNSRIGLSVAASGTTVFGVGDFPGVSSSAILCEGKVIGSSTNQVTYGEAARLPDDTLRVDGQVIKNSSIFLIDDGHGKLINASTGSSRVEGYTKRAAGSVTTNSQTSTRGLGNNVTGTIDYRTGAIDIINGPKNAEFVVSGLFATAIGTGGGSSANGIIASVHARSVTKKVNSKIQILAFGKE